MVLGTGRVGKSELVIRYVAGDYIEYFGTLYGFACRVPLLFSSISFFTILLCMHVTFTDPTIEYVFSKPIAVPATAKPITLNILDPGKFLE
jgi:GTPase SAR1 family protein